MTKSAEDLVATLHQRGDVLACLLDTPLDKRTLSEELSVSRATIARALDDLHEWGLIDPADEVRLTLVGRLVLTVYDDFEAYVTAVADQETDGDPLWRTDAERMEAVGLVADRLAVLECIQTPQDKRTLVTEIALARSTVDRAIRELETAGLVRWTNEGYTTTVIGQRAVAKYRETLTMLTDILAIRDGLDRLPPDCVLPPAVLVGTDLERANEVIPYRLLAGLRDRLDTADRIWAVLPALPNPQLLDVCQHQVVRHGAVLDLVTTPALADTLMAEFPGPLTEMTVGTAGAFTAHVGDVPSFGLLLTDTTTGPTVSVIVYDDQRTVYGAIHTTTDVAVAWAEDYYERVRDGASEVTNEIRDHTPTGTATVGLSGVDDVERVEREAEGFVQLTPEYFAQRAPAPPLTGWRTGFDLADVHAGYAIDREVERDDTRQNLTDNLTERLSEGTNHAVLGPPGSGKSTVCKAVACQWYEQGRGPVFYRTSEMGRPFESPAILDAHLRAAEGHVLVVVEDAVRAEANAVFRLMKAFRGNGTVTFLLDARTGEWTDPMALPLDAGLEAYRREEIETVTVPDLDDPEYKRFVRQFERTVDHDFDSAIVHQLQDRPMRDEVQTQDQTVATDPGELLLFLHRLVSYADPLAGDDARTPTTLIEDVQHTYEDLHQTGELALDVGILVNLLNAAGIGITPALVCTLAVDEENREIEAVRAALSALEGRIVFEREETTDEPYYRTVHEEWSVLFLSRLLDAETEYAVNQRVGRCMTAFLALADESARRDWITTVFNGDVPAIDHIAAAPNEWADTTVEQLFRVGRTHRGLTPLFGATGDSCIDLPVACSPSVTVDCTAWRAQMAREAGDLDRAAREYEAIDDLAREDEVTDSEWVARLHGRKHQGLGIIAALRSEYDTAETHWTHALDRYHEAGDTQRLAETRMNLGNITHHRDDLETAKTYYQQSLDTFRDLGHARKEAKVLYNLGQIIKATDDLSTVVEHYRECLDIYREVGDRRDEATVLNELGLAAARRGNLDTGETYCTQALELCRETGARDREAGTLNYLGRISWWRGDLDRAEEYYQRSITIHQEIGNRRVEAWTWTALGDIARKRGTLDTASEHCTMSLDICREIDDPISKARSLVALGEIARERDDFDTAAEYAQNSLSLYEDTGHTLGAATSRRLLGTIAGARERFMTAEDHLTQALGYFRDTDYRYEEATTLVERGVLARSRDDREHAREWFTVAVEVYHEIGALRDTIETLERLATACEAMDDLGVALAHCETASELAEEAGLSETHAMPIDERRDRLAAHLASDDDG